MTVKELIDRISHLPDEMHVYISDMSGFDILEQDDIYTTEISGETALMIDTSVMEP